MKKLIIIMLSVIALVSCGNFVQLTFFNGNYFSFTNLFGIFASLKNQEICDFLYSYFLFF